MPSLTELADSLAKAANNRTVGRDLRAALGPGAPEVNVVQAGAGWPYDIAIEREGAGYRVSYPSGSRQRFVLSARGYLAAYLYWFHACPPDVRRMTVTASDGDQPSQARFSPSSPSPAQIAIPDPHFFRSRGFAAERQAAAGAPDWASRSDELVWRGLPNGFGRLSFAAGAAEDPTVNGRLRLVMLLHGHADTDVRLSGITEEVARWEAPLRTMGYLASPRRAESWLRGKYAIDIDGHANTWSNLLVRMLFGCCVLKVDSQLGFRQWYYDRLRPFEHYIPVRADMSDLVEKIEWVRGHQIEAAAIAAAGHRFATALDFEAGTSEAVRLISENRGQQPEASELRD